MTDPVRVANSELVNRAFDVWETAVRKANLPPGDTFTVQLPSALGTDDTALSSVVEALTERGFEVARTEEGGGFTVTRTVPSGNLHTAEGRIELRAEAAGSASVGEAHIELRAQGSASGTTQWEGSASGTTPTDNDDDLNDIFQMMVLIAQQQQSASPLPLETVIALLSLLTSVLALLGYSR